ncbi:unnamed protein product [Agarophyton chilense]
MVAHTIVVVECNPPTSETCRTFRPEDYARLLAPFGYVVFAVEYRLALDNPEPQLKPGDPHIHKNIDNFIMPDLVIATTRARLAIGPEPLSHESEEHKMFLWKAAIAGLKDVNKALVFISKNAGDFNIDPHRIAMGGHSARPGITVKIGLGLNPPFGAIFPMSG